MIINVFSTPLSHMVTSGNRRPNFFNSFKLSASLIKKVFSLPIILLILNFPIQAQTLPWQVIRSYYSSNMLYDGVENIYFVQIQNLDNYLWRSSNRGQSWTKFGLGAQSGPFVCDNKRNLWSNAGYGYLYKSSDGGNTWSVLRSPAGAVTVFTTDKNGWLWIGDNTSNIYYSTDMGITWESSNLAAAACSFGFTNDGQVFAGDCFGNIYRSSNYGADWSRVYNSIYRVFKIVVDDSNHIYASKSKSVIISKDNGNSWQEIPGPFLGHSFSMNDQHVFYCNGYRSLDNCGTWTYVGPDENVNKYCFVDSLVFTSGITGVYRYDPGYQPYMGSNFFPLSVGNKWQYNLTEYQSSTNVISYYVDRDSIISGKRYFHIAGEVNDWVRYENDNNVLYLRLNDSDYVLMNFNLNEGSEFSRIHFNSHHILPAKVRAPQYLNLFGSDYFSRGSMWYFFSTPSTHQNHEIFYSEGLGLIKDSDDSHVSGVYVGGILKDLIRAVIHDSSGVNYYSDEVKPVINFKKITRTGSFSMDWSFDVNHSYNNFIDTVLMVSYYSNNSSVVSNDTIYAFNYPGGNRYNIAFSLDSVLMRNEYTFHYKIAALDKGIVQEYSTSPDTGYYKLIYDSTLTSVGDNEINLADYVLMQNFPNPFNPSTVIRFSVPRTSQVSIKIYDVLGNEIVLLVNEYKPAGMHDITWHADGLPSGVYYCQMRSGSFVQTKKLLLLK